VGSNPASPTTLKIKLLRRIGKGHVVPAGIFRLGTGEAVALVADGFALRKPGAG
jgi:hypothetical protein